MSTWKENFELEVEKHLKSNINYKNESNCMFCGQYHTGFCPYVESIEYFPDGRVKKVNFKSIGNDLVQDTLSKFITKEDGFNVAE